MKKEIIESSERDEAIEILIDSLPHGSGINFTWVFKETNKRFEVSNGFYCIDEHGSYDRIANFTVILWKDKKISEFSLQFNGRISQYLNLSYGLREYLEDLFYHSLHELFLNNLNIFKILNFKVLDCY